MRICLDPGHGGSDPGAVGRFSKEKNLNLTIAVVLEWRLWEAGHDCYMTRWSDRTLSLKARADFANRYDCDLFVSIHCNGGHPSAEGIETFHFPGSQDGAMYADQIQGALINGLPFHGGAMHRDRGVKSANFQVLRETNMPGVLVECEFISNPKQEKFLNRGSNQRRLAKLICEGINQ